MLTVCLFTNTFISSITIPRELLELSEALQRDLVQSRSEALHYKQQIENRQYLQDNNEKNLQMLLDIYVNSVVKYLVHLICISYIIKMFMKDQK